MTIQYLSGLCIVFVGWILKQRLHRENVSPVLQSTWACILAGLFQRKSIVIFKGLNVLAALHRAHNLFVFWRILLLFNRHQFCFCSSSPFSSSSSSNWSFSSSSVFSFVCCGSKISCTGKTLTNPAARL